MVSKVGSWGLRHNNKPQSGSKPSQRKKQVPVSKLSRQSYKTRASYMKNPPLVYSIVHEESTPRLLSCSNSRPTRQKTLGSCVRFDLRRYVVVASRSQPLICGNGSHAPIWRPVRLQHNAPGAHAGRWRGDGFTHSGSRWSG